MSSFRFPKTPFAVSALALVLMTGAALAQAPVQSGGVPELPPMPSMPLLPQDITPGEEPRAPLRALPEGASVEDAAARIRDLAAEAGRDLDALTGAALTSEEDAMVRAAAERRRNINVLKDMLEEAQLIRDVLEQVHGEQQVDDPRVAQMEAEKADLERRLAEALNRREASGPSFNGSVVSRIYGAGGNLEATVMLPTGAAINVRRGSELPGGGRVTSITPSGVSVTADGRTVALPMGSRPLSSAAGLQQGTPSAN